MSWSWQGKSWFDADAENLQGQIEAYGEWFTHQPCVAKPNFTPVPDPSRPGCNIKMIFEREAKRLTLGMEATGVSTRELCVTARVCDFISLPRQKDRLQHMCSREIFEVVDIKYDGLAGVALELTQLGKRT